MEKKLDRFWKLLEEGRKDPKAFVSLVAKLSEQELVDFYWTYEDLAGAIQTQELREALPRLVSNDTFDDVASWIIGQGREFYESIDKDPASARGRVPDRPVPSGYASVAYMSYEDRFGTDPRFPDEPPPPNAADA